MALTKVGAPYVLGAKGPKRFDCSGLVYWSINQIDPTLGRSLYTSAGYQYKYCKDSGYLVGESEAQAGDLVFWQKPNCSCGKKYAEVHHTGFYLGDGMILDASSSNGRVIIRKLFDGSSYSVKSAELSALRFFMADCSSQLHGSCGSRALGLTQRSG